MGPPKEPFETSELFKHAWLVSPLIALLAVQGPLLCMAPLPEAEQATLR